jgi:hypothetical protein
MSNTSVTIKDEISFKEVIAKVQSVIRFLLSKGLIIGLISLIGVVIGFFYAQSKQPTYIAATSFSLDEEKSGGGSLLGIASSFGLDMGGGGNLFTNENILQLFGSRKIIYSALLEPMMNENLTHADRLLQITNLNKSLEINKPIYQPNSNANSLNRYQDSVLNLLFKVVTDSKFFGASKPDKKVDIYHVFIKSKDENFSYSFVRAIVNQVSKLYTEIKTTKAKQTVDILQRRVDSLKGSYTRALYGQAAILDANINPTFKSATVPATQKQAEIATSTAASQELIKNLEMSKYALLKQSPLFQIIDEPRFPLEKNKPSRLIYGFIGGFLCAFLTMVVILIRRSLS